MPTQYQIERAAGITKKVAEYIMLEKTSSARAAISCLKLCIDCFEAGAFGLLTAAVKECKREMKGANTHGNKTHE